MTSRPIPVENIYYLLSYAWNVLEEAELASVSVTPEMRLQELLASVLVGGVTHLLKRGLDRAYVSNEEEIAGVRGRLDLGSSLKRATFARARAHCVFDEFSPDVAHNRIVKTTLRQLAGVRGLDIGISEQLRDLYRRMPGVKETKITGSGFRRVMLGRNNSYYGFLLDVCEIVYRNLLVDQTTGETTFRDFTRDDGQMARLFEKFLYNFFEKEQSAFRVDAPRFRWNATGDDRDLGFLPGMRTDIVMSGSGQTIVIDAKYYAKTLTEHFTRESIQPGHLYQMFAYMSHLALDENRLPVRGILIYPRTTQTVRVNVSLFDYPFMAATIDLFQPWPLIRKDLLSMLPLAEHEADQGLGVQRTA